VSGAVLALNIFFVVLSDTAYAVMVGCSLSLYWLDASSSAKISLCPLLRRMGAGCVAAMILSQLVRPWFAAASMSGSSGFTGNLFLVPDILSSTHQGKLWYITSAALVLLLVATLAARQKNRPVLVLPFLVSLVLLACTKAASGHAANEGDFTVAEFFMLLHILGIAVWAGAIVASGLVVLPRLAQFSDPTALWIYGKLLSRTVTWALAAILISGIYTSDRELNGAWSGLWRSDWGRILMTKIAFVFLALALGACTRFRCVQRPATSRTTTLMVRLVRAEAVVMILILSLSGVLANTPPAMTETVRYRRGIPAGCFHCGDCIVLDAFVPMNFNRYEWIVRDEQLAFACQVLQGDPGQTPRSQDHAASIESQRGFSSCHVSPDPAKRRVRRRTWLDRGLDQPVVPVLGSGDSRGCASMDGSGMHIRTVLIKVSSNA
jgi:copper resistance protein D